MITPANDDALLWIGLAEVVGTSKSAEISSAEGAFVHIVGVAEDQEAFASRLSEELDHRGLALISLDEVEPLLDRQVYGHVNQELLEAASLLDEDCPVRFGTFQAFDL
jgi:hypothetical protein